ncbi:MAG: hypothetical protein A3C38_06990 [Planctomycetes bacterium RIFCSPHIGHO2_02_FULL_50_42]|nr:MAG: hypothetical protein A2060_03090 [Planctomycetes bacterium GWA2_50_13]OHB90572.1 MAG: hypothetical protein A3C38_06990 [Planctomycetes bacterium RIFCSPHIGHO2_02_FULL_50_42]OHB94689.1 MAG: hypothetical protein A3I59_09345 [Planctomycetes bacterium RIFCSPLOWO2_02_FULL_50_16]OHC04077.1 MAG: hypothetical protein A3G17_04345 [Planctomycetes bacterium RIFCSPLOWO2_12_FULL_50_35]HCN19301.1 DUF3578 domain-containing protein [Planctomycetia bacterium]
MLRENIERILREYPSAKNEPFSGHALAHFLRHDFPKDLESLVDNPNRYKFTGSAGQGTWANCPWVAVFDILVTESAQSGYYPVYLFQENMKGVYLSLNQGVTEIREKYKDNPKHVLKIRASDFRAQIGPSLEEFQDTPINLAISSTSELAAFYEVGNIYAQYYNSDNLPSEDQLISNFRDMLRLYELLSYNENIPTASSVREQDEPYISKGTEDLRKLREHKRIERNVKLSKAAKKNHGYTCQACGFNFAKFYGLLGEEFIEAHHLTPISELKGQRVTLDPVHDFAVLCSNCHSMIHRFEKPEDIEAFKRILRQRNIN